MDVLTVDMETYYSQEYSLSKLTTEEYIRDSRFEVVGVSVQVNDGEPEWFSGTMKQTKKFLDGYGWDEAVGVAHNAVFDMAILNWHFDIRPKKIADTLSMARPLHGTEVGGSLKALAAYYNLSEKGTYISGMKGRRRLDITVGELAFYVMYCKQDVHLCYQLFKIFTPKFPIEELNLIDMTIRMFTEPVLELDEPLLSAYLYSIRSQKEQLLRSVDENKEDLMSNPKFAGLLRDLGVNPPMKISQRTGKEAYAFAKTDKGFKELLEHENIEVQALASARAGVKSTIEETRAQRFIDISNRGTLPIPLRYYAAHTGRWGGMDKINIQNLPSRGIKTLKKCILAPEGHKLIDCDSSQIEARILAWLAGQDDLVDAFERREDVYKIMAGSIYSKPVSEIIDTERFVGKTTILGCGYGMGAAKFKIQLAAMGVELSEEECEHIVYTYRNTYKDIPKLWRAADKILLAIINNEYTEFGRGDMLKVEGQKGILLPNGLYLKYPSLKETSVMRGRIQYAYSTKRGRSTNTTHIYGGKIIENVCQALAKIVIGKQLLDISRKYKVAMTVHDAGTSVVPIDEIHTAREYIEMCMRIRPNWGLDLPLDCESGVGDSYGECE